MSNFDKCHDVCGQGVKHMIVTFGSRFVNKLTWTFYGLTFVLPTTSDVVVESKCGQAHHDDY